MLGVAVSSVSKWIDDGELMAGRTPGGHRRIEKDDFVAFLHRQNFRVPAELRPETTKILIVDDEKSFAKRLAEEVGQRYPQSEVSVAFDGYSAGEMVGLVRPEVIILDLQMPGMDGYEVCRRIKSNPLIKETAVIAITADRNSQRIDRIIGLGARACLPKPLDVDSLIAEIDKVLRIARPVPATAKSKN
jgi:excisionase family DNA binding protein